MPESKPKFGVEVQPMLAQTWSIGIAISHYIDETCLYINLFKWTISIGKICKEQKAEDDEWEKADVRQPTEPRQDSGRFA